MKAASAGESKDRPEAQLPRRDWILLPAISLITISLMAVSAELIARLLYPEYQVGVENCFVMDDPSGTAPARPNSVCSERTAESGHQVEYRFNSRGDREDIEMQPKQPGTYRIVMIGSSAAMGLFVPRDLTFAATLPAELSQRTGHRIELYNKASGGKFRGGPYPIQGSALRFHDVILAAPDLILWIITPADIDNAALDRSPPEPQANVGSIPISAHTSKSLAGLWNKLIAVIANGSLGDKLRDRWEQSRTSLVLKHLLLTSLSPEQYVESYLKNDDDAAFLRTDPSAKWLRSLQSLEVDATEFEQQARTSDVPFAAVLVPNHVQADMISIGEWPRGYDPYKLDNQLRAVIASHGGTYIDILPDFQSLPSADEYYLPLDGHLNSDGHALISRFLAKELSSGVVPALKGTAQPEAVLAKGR